GLRLGVRRWERWERWEILALQKEGSQGFDETPGDFLHPGENVFLVRGPCCFVVGSGAVTRLQVEVGHTRAHTGDGERTFLDPQGGFITDVPQFLTVVPLHGLTEVLGRGFHTAGVGCGDQDRKSTRLNSSHVSISY